ncbi:MAG: putative DNA binding domain-containing protein [Coriobacteriia bacterium]|nr:putative DNA binding domain-containing protein [Coriobacteriia bacterium]
MDLSPERLRDLVVHVREDLDIEVKGWLDLSDGVARADLAQALLALANHGGGYVVIGFDEADGGYVPGAGRRPQNEYSQDIVNNVVERYASPKFHCDVRLVTDDSGNAYPVVVVHGGHAVPVRAARGGPNNQHVQQNVYYIRRHGPRSESPQTPEEWDGLIRRCVLNAREDMLASIRAVLLGSPLPVEGPLPASILDEWTHTSMQTWKDTLDRGGFPDEHPARFPLGSYCLAYQLVGEPAPVDIRGLRSALEMAQGHETGWPEWMMQSFGVLPPSPIGTNSIACCLASLEQEDPSDCDFWQVATDGRAFLLRGYQEDRGVPNAPPGTGFDVIIPVWRVGEALLHSARLAAQLIEGPAQVRFRATWTGLSDRRLISVGRSFFARGTAHVPIVRSEVEYPVEAVRDTLPELVGRLIAPLHAAFDFYELSPMTIQGEIDSLRRR